MELQNFSKWLDELLEPAAFQDYCTNGLCVEASSRISRVVTGVSFRDALIDAAIERNADCILVHHPNGFWKNESRIPVGRYGERLGRLFRHGISLYGFHLPLDAHPEIGNNALIAKAMQMNPVQGFMQEGEKSVGVIAEWDFAISRQEFLDRANAAFEHGVQNAFLFGSEKIKRVGICSGSGASGMDEAIRLGCEAFITGEIKEAVPIACEEGRFNLINCGHHRTEIFGVRALAEKIERELKIPATFVDFDNPI